jgi:hypothetical protein
MGLTKEYLVNLRDQAVVKRQEYITLVNQANGAIDILNMLIEQVNKPDAGD